MKRTITVTGSASVSVAPDCARLHCGVQVSGVNAQDALRRSNAAMQAIVAALAGAGVAPADVRTHGPNLWPDEQRYLGSNDVTVVVRDLASLGSVIDGVAEAGGPDLTMRGVTFSVSDPIEHLPAARRAAMDAALVSATDLATAGGAAVGEVVTITEPSVQHAPVMARAEAFKMSTPVEPGTEELSVSVTVRYRLVDPS